MKESLQEVKTEKERRDLQIEAETEARREVETGIVSVVAATGIVVETVVIEETVVVETAMMTTAEAAVTVTMIGDY